MAQSSKVEVETPAWRREVAGVEVPCDGSEGGAPF